MKKDRKQYDREFKINAVKLVLRSKGKKTMQEIAEDLGINGAMLSQWKKEYLEKGENKAFRGANNMSAEQEEIKKLKEELELVKMERDILKKAAAIFSRDEN